MALLIAAYYGLPGLRVETWGLIGLSGVTAIVAGVIINHPSRKAPWLLLAAAQASFAAGQVSFLVAQADRASQLPFPSFADLLYLLTYPLYAAALLIFIRWRTPDRDRRSLIDALTLTAGLALLSWIYLVLPYVHNPALSWLQKSVAIAYPLGDVLVLAMLARLLAPGTARTRSSSSSPWASSGCWRRTSSFGADPAARVVPQRDHRRPRLGRLLRRLGRRGAASDHDRAHRAGHPAACRGSPVRLIVLMLASLIAPVVLFIQSLRSAAAT